MKLDINGHPLIKMCESLLEGCFYFCSIIVKVISSFFFEWILHALSLLVNLVMDVVVVAIRLCMFVPLGLLWAINEAFQYLHTVCAEVKTEHVVTSFFWVTCMVATTHLLAKVVNVLCNQSMRLLGCVTKIIMVITQYIKNVIGILIVHKKPLQEVLYNIQVPFIDNVFSSISNELLALCSSQEEIYFKHTEYWQFINLPMQSNIRSKRTTKQSWFGLIFTKAIKLLCIGANFLIDLTLGLVARVLKVTQNNIYLLAHHMNDITEEIKHGLEVICEKTNATNGWISSFTAIIMFIPNCLISLLSHSITCVIDTFDVFICMVALPPTICLKLLNEFGFLLEHYFPGKDLYEAPLYKPKARNLVAYELLQQDIVIKHTDDNKMSETNQKHLELKK